MGLPEQLKTTLKALAKSDLLPDDQS